jgi:hypothetical protein
LAWDPVVTKDNNILGAATIDFDTEVKVGLEEAGAKITDLYIDAKLGKPENPVAEHPTYVFSLRDGGKHIVDATTGKVLLSDTVSTLE